MSDASVVHSFGCSFVRPPCPLTPPPDSTDEEGPEGLTQFLLLEVRKLREQLRNSRMCERRLSQRCRMAEEERSRAERKAQERRHDRLQLERWASLLQPLHVLAKSLIVDRVNEVRADVRHSVRVSSPFLWTCEGEGKLLICFC